MKKLYLLLVLLFTSSVLASGYPVFRTLRENVYEVDDGTAFQVHWKDKYYMVTNWHVCRNWNESDAINHFRGFTGRTKVLYADPQKDLCITTAVWSDGLEIGEAVPDRFPVYTAGYPSNSRDKPALASGWTTQDSWTTLDFGPGECPIGFKKEFNQRFYDDQLKRKVTRDRCWGTFLLKDTTMDGWYGRSGSPVISAKGKLVGIVNSKNDHTSSYLPVKSLIEILDSLKP